MAKLQQFLQGHPKPAFSEKVQRGDQRKFFKNRPKRCPRWKGPKAHWRKWHYPLISMRLKCKDWRRFRRKQRLQKCPNGQVIAIFARSPKTRIFWKSAKGGPRKIFQKSPKKVPSLKRPKSTLAQMAQMAKTVAPKGPEQPSYGNFGKVTQNPHFLKKCKGGTKGNFSKIPQKVAFA